ncbi:Similar to Ras-like GTP-binding protein RYL2; acc. no. P41925 [Pyronema omphalodes CBS 100304]|uniref:Similar to Ras-like GTP-binding protein RYL2 acc. no. P41925 n=1 Tax=Pyronema omphalodes (strain CBS 100304) TaxID=1076935 RepID=U4L621_PYROM|nr:Similar to Ras-like GTP-binding protein RYL2; acc. no. P41925 [Pyronema omphalodes CBS 100304]
MDHTRNNAGSLEAKLVVLGTQGVGKTSLVVRYETHTSVPTTPVKAKQAPRYVKNTFDPQSASTIGASFLAKKVPVDDTVVKLQDTAGQERYRSISKLYYRSANCGILCYDITSEASFLAMHSWLLELKKNIPNNIIIHIVGTKADLVNADPTKREVPFERCVAYAAEHLGDGERGGYTGMDTCHEISARDDTGIDEVFQVISRKLVEKRLEIEYERLYGVQRHPVQNGADITQQNDAGSGRCC